MGEWKGGEGGGRGGEWVSWRRGEGRGGEGRSWCAFYVLCRFHSSLLQGDPAEAVLWRFVDGGEGGEEEEGVAGARRLVEYYVRVMRLFEQASAPTLVIDIATVATGVACRDDPNCVSFLLVALGEGVHPVYVFTMTSVTI